jgi:hypothetical protein
MRDNAFLGEGRFRRLPQGGTAMNTVSRWTRSIVMLTATAIGVSPALHAQNNPGRTLINVPFAFDYGSRHFASGVYELNLYSTRFLIIHTLDGSKTATAMLQEETTTRPSVRSEVLFLKTGSCYQLQTLRTAGSNEYFHTIPLKVKKQPKIASDRAPSSTVEVALLEEPAHTRN